MDDVDGVEDVDEVEDVHTTTTPFDPQPVLKYLGLPPTYDPSPKDQPLVFLRFHLSVLPSALLAPFSSLVTPRDRAVVPLIRNRRLAYAQTTPRQLSWDNAVRNEPALWASLGGSAAAASGARMPRLGEDEANEEKEWAEKEFMGRTGPEGRGAVGNIARLLGGYEEERVGEVRREERRARARRRGQMEVEKDDDMDDMEEEEEESDEDESPEGTKGLFERIIKERYFAGLLDWAEYDADWDDAWDVEEGRDREERWFDEEEEG